MEKEGNKKDGAENKTSKGGIIWKIKL